MVLAEKLQYDADMQTALMPQELNPAYVPEKGEEQNLPWKTIQPMRFRRSYTTENQLTTIQEVKKYSRIVSCVVLIISTIVEVVLYIIEFYYIS
ncbi:uncharacterized protein ACR2FA_002255 [Aphomia sociella]